MKITVKHGKREFEKIIHGDLISVYPPIEDIYQNSNGIKDVKMEISKYSIYGCRAIALFRRYNQILLEQNKILKPIDIIEYDFLADQGGEFHDAWYDNKDHPVYDILNSGEMTKRIENRYKIKLELKIIRKEDYNKDIKLELIDMAFNNNSFIIKMPHLYMNNSYHFVNTDGFIFDHKSGELYFRMKETYKNYNGYDGKFVEWKFPDYYEIIKEAE